MSDHDPMNGLRVELQALPARHRRAVLKALTAAERSQVISLLAQSPRPPAPAPATEPDAGADDGLLDGHSSLIASRVQGAREDVAQPAKRWKMTAAARRRLLASAEVLWEERQSRQQQPVGPRGRSLLGALGSWFVNGVSPR